MKFITNIITALRIVAAVLMLFTVPLSVPFFVFYTVGGVSDMIDGMLARKLGTAGEFGGRLDSIADLLFFVSVAIKLLPTLWGSLPVYALWEVAVIAGIKCITAVLGAVKFSRLCFLHTHMNKLTGAAVFLLPYFLRVGCFAVLAYAACGIAFLAAVEEFACVVKMEEYDVEIKGAFIKNTLK